MEVYGPTHGGNVYDEPPTGHQWLDFSANINPLGLAPSIRQTMLDQIDSVIHYPDPQGRALKAALSDHYSVSRDSLILGNGAAELFYVFFHAFRPRSVLVPAPGFSEYERAARAGGCRVLYYDLDASEGFAMPWGSLSKRLGDVDVAILANPNNPTGTLLTTEEVRHFLAEAKKAGTFVIIDESFLDFCYDRATRSALSLVREGEPLIVCTSLTKFYALPGLRLGFAAAPPSVAYAMAGHVDCWNVNVLAQAAGVTALADRAFQEATRRVVADEMEFVYRGLQAVPGFEPVPPSVNFILVDCGATGYRAAEWTAALRQQGILVRDCTNYRNLPDHYLRFAVKNRDENMKLFSRIKSLKF